ncbi:sigma-70 family RNA polymerase sigma factor [Amycolatopsis sp. RTGN1]|uniref:sigma-70 family RNA polymerase sigma factor n=1 Tax=Amycolatopsis ponsaeliensis TaxID=2992142 RepID=UPI00254F2539|nr:sigma-70 family RNA polymerase sigma factor [Amycolatopsis sp. RTGN1]
MIQPSPARQSVRLPAAHGGEASSNIGTLDRACPRQSSHSHAGRCGTAAANVDLSRLDDLVTRAQQELRSHAGTTRCPAVEELFAMLQPVIVTFCRSRLGRGLLSMATADDVAQEIATAVLKALPGYTNHQNSFMPFVYGIARHKIADAFRVAGRDRTQAVATVPELVDAAATPEEHFLRRGNEIALATLLTALPQRQRDVIILRFHHGLSARKTGALLDCSDATVRVTQHRAIRTLREAVFHGHDKE